MVITNGGSSGNIRWNHANGNIVDGSQGSTSGSTGANDDIIRICYGFR